MNNELEKRVEVLEQRLKKLESMLSGNDTKIITNSKKISIKEFLLTKNIDDDVKRTLVLTYFLEHMENYKSVNTDDLKKAFSLAKHPLPSNINDKVNMNIKNAHMMESDEKKDNKKAWVLTATGEKFVETELNN